MLGQAGPAGAIGMALDDDTAAMAVRARAFFDAHASRRPETGEPRLGEGPDALVAAGLAPGRDEPDIADAARAFQRQLFDAGLAWLTGPRPTAVPAWGRSTWPPSGPSPRSTRRQTPAAS